MKKKKSKSTGRPVGGTAVLPFEQFRARFQKGLIKVNPNAGISLPRRAGRIGGH